eukprot:g28365.t1
MRKVLCGRPGTRSRYCMYESVFGFGATEESEDSEEKKPKKKRKVKVLVKKKGVVKKKQPDSRESSPSRFEPSESRSPSGKRRR